jgi:hypothetical protein
MRLLTKKIIKIEDKLKTRTGSAGAQPSDQLPVRALVFLL